MFSLKCCCQNHVSVLPQKSHNFCSLGEWELQSGNCPSCDPNFLSQNPFSPVRDLSFPTRDPYCLAEDPNCLTRDPNFPSQDSFCWQLGIPNVPPRIAIVPPGILIVPTGIPTVPPSILPIPPGVPD